MPNKSKLIASYNQRAATIEFYDNNLVIYKMKEKTIVELQDAIEHIDLMNKHFSGKKFRVYVESAHFGAQSKEARRYSGQPENTHTTAAVAILVNNISNMLIVNAYNFFRLNKQMEVKAFKDKASALKWLDNFK